jgi:hypothetical protein
VTERRQFEEVFGVQVVESRHALADPDSLAAHPESRAEDLMRDTPEWRKEEWRSRGLLRVFTPSAPP